MKKVIVIGCAGSGKSVFSRALHEKTGLPLYPLDMIYWKEDKTNVSRQEFDSKLMEILQKDFWIIDGNYGRTMELRMQYCDTIFYLDYPTQVCLDGIEKRRGKPRQDMPCVLGDDDEEFIEFIKNYNTVNRPVNLQRLEKFKDKTIIIFKSREQSEEYLMNM